MIIPTITATNKSSFKEQFIRAIMLSTTLHIDISDGKFTDKKMPLYFNFLKSHCQNYQYEFHLMVNRPEKYFKKLSKLGAKKIIVHIESMNSARAISILKKFYPQIIASCALLPTTTTSKLSVLSPVLSEIMLFGGSLGSQGGTQDQTNLSKIPDLRKLFPKAKFSWDGGINAENIKKLQYKGVELFNVGSYLSKSSAPINDYQGLILLTTKQNKAKESRPRK